MLMFLWMSMSLVLHGHLTNQVKKSVSKSSQARGRLDFVVEKCANSTS
jgi:hypothetical protein